MRLDVLDLHGNQVLPTLDISSNDVCVCVCVCVCHVTGERG